ncbi:5-carboxymethyl-2-hydroxymuconate Delta-isomerase [Lysobacter sp. S4-A87]|uniref:5-carboxymethyl-2-hydroxymuconate Delta-isomerase n=1 Tax=Lysobacter sp. S4-A87 TaxID=2925843 RepID=UPI001F53D7B1|nr:5-carboxymethyl-2-hydroxymuconate Delta-isomerase [Lysobacter sp. S4-A87]UNK48691.1 5-carboxymethyl-2-hydroxymuconate Delta-isomerase [Lysobacter sp. S4-A87]
MISVAPIALARMDSILKWQKSWQTWPAHRPGGLRSIHTRTHGASMPHFVVDCSQGLLQIHSEESIITRLHRVASASGLFDESDIKVRMRPFDIYAVGGEREDFIHTFAWIMQGRSIEQRAALSKAIVSELAGMFPLLPRIAVNIAEFEKATYFNRTMM